MAESLAANMIWPIMRVRKLPKVLYVIVQATAPTVDINAEQGAPSRRFEELCGVNIFAPSAVKAVKDHLDDLNNAATRDAADPDSAAVAPPAVDGGADHEHGEHPRDGEPPLEPHIRGFSADRPGLLDCALCGDSTPEPETVAAAPQMRSKTKRQHKGTVVNPIAISDSDGDEWKPSAAESAKKRKSPLMKSGGRTKPAARKLLAIERKRKMPLPRGNEGTMDNPLEVRDSPQAVNNRESDEDDGIFIAADDDAALYPMRLSDDEPNALLDERDDDGLQNRITRTTFRS